MSRLTKNISDKQTYCGYEVKDCKYQQIYGFKRYNELEDYVDCDLTLAIDKLGQLEDLEEELGCPLEVVFKALKDGIYYEDIANRMKYMVVDLHCNLLEDFILYFNDDEALLTRNYKKTWWLKKDKSE